jgi:Hsp70 protein
MRDPKITCWGVMVDQSKSDAKRNDAEVLVWIGTAYGRRRDAKSTPQANALVAFHLDQLPRHKRGVVAVLIVLFAVTATALVQVQASARFLGITWTENARQTVTPQEPEATQLSEDAHPRTELDGAANEAKAQLTNEHEARVALEARVERLVSELAAQTHDRQNAERASADASTQLAAEHKARVDAEDAAKASREALARIESSAATAAVVPSPVPLQKAQVERKPAESPTSWEATARVVTTSVNAADNSDAAGSALLQGEKLFAKGDLEAARQRFEQAAKTGMPEGALALGNTYDPVSLAKAGLNLTGDPTRARQWYRRAVELAQIQRGPRQ